MKLLHYTHLGFNKISKVTKELFYWPVTTSYLKSFVGQCKTCMKFSKS